MKKNLLCVLIISLCSNAFIIQAQNQTNKWYFGTKAGLDFMTNPPTVLTNGIMSAFEGCATMSDASGNLLFYTQGTTIWNKNHMGMDNGIGLLGNTSSTQGTLIEKQPGNSNIYYAFTVYGPNPNPYWGVNYSIVDMSLSAGMGSVTTASEILSTNTTERLTSTRHCNGIDTWIITHDYNSADFKVFLLTAAGVNTVPVVSTAGPVLSHTFAFVGSMKVSPNGKKLALSAFGHGFYLYDFDIATGTVSNALTLFPITNVECYGIEFSPDGTKLYGTTASSKNMYQWDLCSGNDPAIVASQYTVYTGTTVVGSLQRASDGKIYVARWNQQELGVINNPNLVGSACGYVDLGVSVAPKISMGGLPNFNLQYRNPVLPFTYTTMSCSEAVFSTTVPPPSTVCPNAATYSLIGQSWSFGDPASGSANTSTLSNPTHVFPGTGSYTTQLILYYSCGGGTDTLRQTVTVTNTTVPTVSVSGVFTMCAGSNHTYTASGANTYSWSTGASMQSIFVTPTITTVYTVTGTSTGGCSSQKTFTVAITPCTGINEQNRTAGETVRVFPNPNSHYVYIECTSHVNVLIMDQQGQVILQQVFEAGSNKMDTESLSNGVYFLRTVSAAGITTSRLIKMSE